MGMTYARLDGHPEDVCLGIHEHYLPVRAEGELPASAIGAMVGMADRMDTVTGCFAIGQEPTGTADPFALRRHALAILRILEDRKWPISLKDFVTRSLAMLGKELPFDGDQVFKKVFEFFRERYKNMMLRSGYENDLTEAVLSAGFDRVDQLRERIHQLKGFAEASPEFEPLALTFKRVTNILKKEDREHPVNPALFSEPCERNLWQAYLGVRDEVHALAEAGQYEEALQLMAGLRKPVDDLFDGVEVLTKSDADLRNNRVGLLQALSDLFLSVADLSKFSI
jgi:glycyl-tRNA synthetase beta chain